MGFRDAITSNVKSLGVLAWDVKDFVWGIVDTAGQLIQTGVSEFITNKDEGKWIKDYDKFQEYSAQLNDPTLGDDERANIFGLMKQDNVIDPVKFSQWQKQSQAKKSNKAEEDLTSVRKELEDNIMEQLKKADTRYKKDAIIWHIDEIMKDYQDLADSYRQTKEDNPNIDDNLWRWNKTRWLQIVKDKSKQFSENILRGATDDEAYDRMMANDKGEANELVNVDQDRRIYLYWEQIRNDFGTSRDELKSGNVIWSLYNWFKWIMNSISALGTEAWDILEEWKQMLGYYDTLEEWSNLDLEKWALNKIKARWFELFDWANRIAPSVATIWAGNKAMEAMKIEQLITKWLQSSKYLRLADEAVAEWADAALAYSLDAIKPSKAAKFISENLWDALLFDAAAQSAMWRPLTDEDFMQNWIMNIPINAWLAMFVKGWLKNLWLPKININDWQFSKEVIDTIVNNANLTKDDIAKIIVADKYYNPAAEKIDFNSISYRWVQSKINEAMVDAQKYVDNMKTWAEDLSTKTLKAQISNMVDNWTDSYMKQWDMYSSFIERTNLMNKKINEVITNNNYRPQLQSLILKSLDFTDDELKSVIDSSSVSQTVKDVVTLQMLKSGKVSDAEKLVKWFIDNLKSNPQWVSKELQTVYNDLTEQLVLKNPQKLKAWDMVWPYVYTWNNSFKTLTWHEVSAEDVMYDIRLWRGTYKDINSNVWKWLDAISNVEARLDFVVKHPWNFPSKGLAQEIIISDIFWKIKVLPDWTTQHMFHYGSDYAKPNMDVITINKFWRSLFEPFGIKFSLSPKWEWLVITWAPEQVSDLLSTIRTLKSKWFSYATMTDKEMAAFKAIHIWEFAEAYWNKLEWSTWFDSLFKKTDGGYAMDFKVINPQSAWKQMRLYAKDFKQTEEVSAQYSITDMIADALVVTWKENKQAFLSEVKRIMWKDNPIADRIANYYWDFVETYVKDIPHLDKLNVSSVLWQMFWEIVSDRTLLKMLNTIPLEDSKTLMSSIIARILNKNQGWIVLLKTFKNIMETNKLNASFIRPFLNSVDFLWKDYRWVVWQAMNNIINSKRLIEIWRLTQRVSKEDWELFKKSLANINKDVKDFNLAEATTEQVESVVKYQVYDSLKRRGYLSESFAKKLIDKYTKAILNMKENLLKRWDDAQIKMVIWAWHSDEFFYQQLSDWVHKITIPTLVDSDLYLFIRNPDNFFELAYKHEKSHYLLNKMWEKEYFTALIDSVKKLRQLPTDLHDIVYWYKWLEVDIKNLINTAYDRYIFAAGNPIELNKLYKSITKEIEELLVDQVALWSKYMEQWEIDALLKNINNVYNISYAVRNVQKYNMSRAEFEAYVNWHLNRQYMSTDMYVPSILSKTDLPETKSQTRMVYDDVFKKTINDEYLNYKPNNQQFVPLSDILKWKAKKEWTQYIISDSTIKMLAEDFTKNPEELKWYDIYQIKMNPIYNDGWIFKINLQDKKNISDFVPWTTETKKIEFWNYETNIDEQIDSTVTKQTSNKNLVYINNIWENIWKEYKLTPEKTIPVSEAVDWLRKISHSADAFITKIWALLKASWTKDALNGIKIPLKNILVWDDVIKLIPEWTSKESFLLNRNVANILSTYWLYSQSTIDLLNKSSLGLLKDKEYVNILKWKVDEYIDYIVKFINDTWLREKKAWDLVARDDFSMALNTYFKTMDEAPLIENIIKNFWLEEKTPKISKVVRDAWMWAVNIRDELFSIDPSKIFNKHIDDMSLKYNPSQYLISETKPSWFIEYNSAVVARRAYLADKWNAGKRALELVWNNKSIRGYIENPTPLKKIFAAETMWLDFIKESAPDLYKQTTFIIWGEAKLADSANIYELLYKAVTWDKKITMKIWDEVKTYEGWSFRRNPLFFKFDDIWTADEETILKNIFSTLSPFQLKNFWGYEAKLYKYIKKTNFQWERISKLDQLRDSVIKDWDWNEYKILWYRPTLIWEKQITETLDVDDLSKIEYEYSEVLSPVYFMKDWMWMDEAREILNMTEEWAESINKVASMDDIKITDRYIDILIQDSKWNLKEAEYDTINKTIDNITKYSDDTWLPKQKEIIIDKVAYKDAEQMQRNALDSLWC